MSSEQRTFYVTTPIYYVTARPHLGSLYSTVLADVAARWHQIRGEKTFLLTGTDEHGQKVAQAAQQVGKDPRPFVDSFIEAFTETWKRYHINYHHFIRTTDPAHIHAVQQWIRQLIQQGDIYRSEYEGYYCTPCETFVMERAEEGDVPLCPTCHRRTSLLKEPSYFFRLSAYQERLLAWYDAHPEFMVPAERMNEVRSFVESGLKDLAISRSRSTVSWGIPFPGDETQIVYVWADALNNYISAVGYADPSRILEFNTWWPAQLQVLGKDIVRFHAIYWPAFLMAAGLPLPERLLVHGWIKVGDQKMSKSLHNVVDPIKLLERYDADVIRYYLIRAIAITHDASFTIEDLETRTNADLANDLGNLLQRLLSLAHSREYKILTVPEIFGPAEQQLYEQLSEILYAFSTDMEACFFHRAYAQLWRGITLVNAYVHTQQPWKLKNEQERVQDILAVAVHAVTVLGFLAWPVMPHKMEQLLTSCGVSWQHMQKLVTEKGGIGMPRGIGTTLNIIPLPTPLFPRIESLMKPESTTPLITPNAPEEKLISIDEFSQVVLAVGTITEVAEIPKSDKLYQLTVDLGTYGIRTICSGVRAHFTTPDLKGKQGVFVVNLAPRKMMGIPSQGMMLFAEDASQKLQLIAPALPVPNGTRLK